MISGAADPNRLAHIVTDDGVEWPIKQADIQTKGAVRTLSPDPVPTVSEVGEQVLIDLFTTPDDDARGDHMVLVGPGDDAAVLAGGGPVVVSTDALVDGRHFRMDWSSPEQIGFKAVVANAADVISMGGRVTGFLASVTCPKDIPVATLIGLRDGMRDAARRYGANVVGGDLTAGDQLVLAVTAIGAMDARTPVRLSTAQVGDVVAVSGPLGSSAAGMELLSAGIGDFTDLVRAHCAPEPHLELGVAAAEAGVHSMTDISDGLMRELHTMSRAAGLRIEIDAAAIPVVPELPAAAARLGVDMNLWTTTGGEDHELLATFAAGELPAGWTAIGSVHAGPADPPVTVRGMDAVDLEAGWHTF